MYLPFSTKCNVFVSFQFSQQQEEDNKKGGITLERYQELYAQFMGNENAKCPAIYLYGPIPE